MVWRLGKGKFHFVTLGCSIVTLAVVGKMKELAAICVEDTVFIALRTIKIFITI